MKLSEVLHHLKAKIKPEKLFKKEFLDKYKERGITFRQIINEQNVEDNKKEQAKDFYDGLLNY